MNQRPFTSAQSAQAELNVSIAGSSHETMEAALDEAVARLNKVTTGNDPSQPGEPPAPTQKTIGQQPIASGPIASGPIASGPNALGPIESQPIDPAVILSLLQTICAAETRQLAISELVTFLDARSADCTVRAGFGNDRMTRIYDPRLGWLGSESSLFDQFQARWNRYSGSMRGQASQASEVSNDSNDVPYEFAVVQTETGIAAVMTQPDGTGRCLLWIDGPANQLARVAWLPSAIAAIGTALWSRPGRAWPAKVAGLFQRSKASVTTAAVVFLIAAFWPVHYRVDCDAKIETTAQRLIATPFDATLERSNFKPGDIVSAGDVLLVLDGRPLRLEREAIEAEQQQVAKEHDAALAAERIADAQQASLKKRHLARRHDLLSDRLAHLEVVSPIDGVVVSGDLERNIGSPLERGQTVMEIAPMNRMVIEVEIPEHEIGYVTQGAETRIKLDAIGGKSIRKPIQNIYPRAELRDDQNVFIARIAVENVDRSLKPGMIGEATTYGPLRPWLWSWVRGGVEKILWWIGY